MKELQTVALGLVVVFLDVGDPDWVADPLGWLLVLVGLAAVKDRIADHGYLALTAWVCLALSVVTWPPGSVPTLDDTLGWLFSLPTLAFCFLLADSVGDVTTPEVAGRFRVIAWTFALVAVLPLFSLLLDWTWLDAPATVLAVLADVVLVLSLFGVSDESSLRSTGEPDGAGGKAGDTDEANAGSSGREGASAAERAKEKAKQQAKETTDTVTDTVRSAAAGTARTAREAVEAVRDTTTRGSGSTGPETDSPADDEAGGTAEVTEGKHKA